MKNTKPMIMFMFKRGWMNWWCRQGRKKLPRPVGGHPSGARWIALWGRGFETCPKLRCFDCSAEWGPDRAQSANGNGRTICVRLWGWPVVLSRKIRPDLRPLSIRNEENEVWVIARKIGESIQLLLFHHLPDSEGEAPWELSPGLVLYPESLCRSRSSAPCW